MHIANYHAGFSVLMIFSSVLAKCRILSSVGYIATRTLCYRIAYRVVSYYVCGICRWRWMAHACCLAATFYSAVTATKSVSLFIIAGSEIPRNYHGYLQSLSSWWHTNSVRVRYQTVSSAFSWRNCILFDWWSWCYMWYRAAASHCRLSRTCLFRSAWIIAATASQLMRT